MNKKTVAVVGASGYSGEELVGILLRHPDVELAAITSRQYAGKLLSEVFPRFANYPIAKKLKFIDSQPDQLAKLADVVFLALPHGVAASYAAPLLNSGAKVIDLSADFRLRSPEVYKEFYGTDHPAPELLKKAVYGLPEIYRDQIINASLIASPGCYPTSILIPLIPIVKKGLIDSDNIIVDSLSGVSGAGRKLETDYLFCECNESLRAYGFPKHRHLSEIEEQISFSAGSKVVIQFTPHLVPVNRGILTTIYLKPSDNNKNLNDLSSKMESVYKEYYSNSPFVRILKSLPDTKNITGTNVIEFSWKCDPRTGRVIIVSAVDNLVKGAGGQAVQSMNVLCGFNETDGLTLA